MAGSTNSLRADGVEPFTKASLQIFRRKVDTHLTVEVVVHDKETEWVKDDFM